MNTPENKMHPLIMLAATSVTVASLAAIASFAGFLPGKSTPASELTAASTAPAIVATTNTLVPEKPAAESISPPAPAAKAAPVQKPLAKPAKEKTPLPAHPNHVQSNAAPPAPMPTAVASAPVTPPICHECGSIESIRETKVRGEGSGLGAIAGGVIGGLLGNQMGHGSGKAVATVAAAAGGAYAGNMIEQNAHPGTQVEITVRFDNDSIRSYQMQEASRWRQGDRVRLVNGRLQPL